MRKSRTGRWLLVLLVVCGIVAAVVRLVPERAVASTIFGDLTPGTPAFNDARAVTLGVRFVVRHDGIVRAVRYYQGPGNSGPHVGAVYDESGRKVAGTASSEDASPGWHSIALDSTLRVEEGAVLTAAVFMPYGHYAVDSNFSWPHESPGLTGQAGTYAYGSSITYPTAGFRGSNYWVDVDFSTSGSSSVSTSTPSGRPTTRSSQDEAGDDSPSGSPSATATPSAIATRSGSSTTCAAAKDTPGGTDPWGGCWPGSYNTGYPHGLTGDTRAPVTLTPYTGPSKITTCGTVIDSKIVSDYLLLEAGNGTHDPKTPCLTIRNSLVKGVIHTDDPKYGPVVVTDSEVDLDGDVGFWENIGRYNVFVSRVDSHGGEAVIRCADYCSVTDSYVHGAFLGGSYHYNAFGSNGIEPEDGYFRIEHDWASCGDWSGTGADVTEAANCSSDIGFYGDFAPIHDVTINRTFLRGATFDASTLLGRRQPGYCLNPGFYPGKPFPRPTDMTITENVFGRGSTKKCGVFGATNSLGPAGSTNGNVWKGNTFTDGTRIEVVEE